MMLSLCEVDESSETMQPKPLRTLLDSLPKGELVALEGDADTPITAPVVESAQDVQPGGIFVARRGLTADGHTYIPQAIARGAAAVVGERDITGLTVPYAQVKTPQAATGWMAAAYHDFPSRRMVVVGVTGTDGKTTTSTLIHSILKFATNGSAGYISTIAADLGGKTADTGLHVTTPTAPEVQAYLAQMVENGLTHCVLEMTSHGLAQGRLNGVDVDVAVMTNVTHEHLDYHGSWEAYRDAKARMFRMLATAHRKPGQPKLGVVNADDPSADYFAAIPADKTLLYGIGEAGVQAGGTRARSIASLRATDITYLPDGTHFKVGEQVYALKLVGAFNVLNALAAIAAASGMGIAPEHIRRGVEAVESLSGRMQRIDEGQNFTAIVDFAHTPNALKNALLACRPMLPEGNRLVAVFGSAGLRDVEKRRMMAEVSAEYADFTVLTAEDPRTESLDAILQMMADGCVNKGGVEGETFIRVPDRGEAIYRACQMAQPGDLVVACGKGHEQSMCFGTIEYPWDDRDAMRAALRGAPLKTLPTAQDITNR